MRPAVLVRKTLRQVERAARLGAAERNLQYLRWHPAGRVAKLALNRCLSVLGLDPSAVHFIFRWVLEYAFLGTVIRGGSCTRAGCRCGCSEEQTRLAYLALPLARRLELAWDKEVAPVRRVRSGALAEGAARAEEGRSGGGKRRRRAGWGELAAAVMVRDDLVVVMLRVGGAGCSTASPPPTRARACARAAPVLRRRGSRQTAASTSSEGLSFS